MSIPPSDDSQSRIHAMPSQNPGATTINQNNRSSTIAERNQRDTISSACIGSAHEAIGILHNMGNSLHALSTWLLDKFLCVLTLGYIRCRPEAGAAATTQGSTNAASVQEQLQNLQNIITSDSALFTDEINAFLAALEIMADDSCDQNALDNEIRRLFQTLDPDLQQTIQMNISLIRSRYADLEVSALHPLDVGQEILHRYIRHPIVRAAAKAAQLSFPKGQIQEIENQIRNNSLSGAEKARAFLRVFHISGSVVDLNGADITQEIVRLFDVLSLEAADQANAIKQAMNMMIREAYRGSPHGNPAVCGLQFQGRGLQADDVNHPDLAAIVISENKGDDFIRYVIHSVIYSFELNG
ncbi:MAG: hypothetical protein Tsb0015_13940 [Simkaniaceae bacterium]